MENIFAGLLSLFGYTLNPMGDAQNQIDHFQMMHSQNINTYQGVHRQMGYAFAGEASKRAVLFVHGSPGTKAAWYAFLLNPRLSSRFHLLTVDRPGYGSSGEQSEVSLERQAEDIWEVLRLNRSVQRPILVGHSFGGAVVAKIAALHPDAVAGLVFVASSVDPAHERVKFIQRVGATWGVRSVIPQALRVCNEEILGLKAELEAMLPAWVHINARVAIVHGDRDDLVPVENADFISSKLKVESRRILKGMNHFIPWRQPDAIEKAILELDVQ